MARRHLNLTPAQWDGLPWWEQQAYLEGYEWEGLIERSDGSDPTVISEEVHQAGGTTIIDREHEATFSGLPGEMTAFGLRETNI